MPKVLALPVLVLLCLATFVATAAGHKRDRDHDGLPDRWEKRYHLSTKKKSGKGDPDNDRLRNRREYKLRLNPRKADSDGDGLRDRAELRRHQTSPRRRDSDGDGYSDRREIRAGTDPNDPNSYPGAGSGDPPPPPDPGPGPAPGGFPSPASTGVPAGWVPKQVRTSNWTITTPGAVIDGVQFDNADLILHAPNVTVRNSLFRGGSVYTDHDCHNGHVIEDTTFEPRPGQTRATIASDQLPSIWWGGYTARRVKLWNRGEGFTVGAKSSGCAPVVIEDSFAKLSVDCGAGVDWHSDGVQGYDGNAVIVRNTTIDFREASCGTAAFFYPHSQGNISADVDRLLVTGGGYPFRLGTPGSVRNLKIVDRSWGYGPIDVRCSALSTWNASIVTITSNYQVASEVRSQPCNTNGGG